MYKGLIITLCAAMLVASGSSTLLAQIYKVVDENGNVTYTDEPPKDGTPEMVLPEISVIESDYQPEAEATDPQAAEGEDAESAEAEAPKSPRELRAMYRDFRILAPQPEQAYWGTGNVVVVSWGAGAPYEEGMSVSVVVNGESHTADPAANLPVTLERGEHEVYVVLHDSGGRRIITTDTVKFYVHQASRNFNPG